MIALERFVGAVLLLVLVLLGTWFGVKHYGAEQRQAGWDAAVATGKEQREAAELAALAIESGLRARLLEQDTAAFNQERKHVESLEAAQRCVRAGVDRLRCPAESVQATTPAGDRPAAARPDANGEGPAIVPEVAAEILGDAADVGGTRAAIRARHRAIRSLPGCKCSVAPRRWPGCNSTRRASPIGDQVGSDRARWSLGCASCPLQYAGVIIISSRERNVYASDFLTSEDVSTKH